MTVTGKKTAEQIRQLLKMSVDILGKSKLAGNSKSNSGYQVKLLSKAAKKSKTDEPPNPHTLRQNALKLSD